MAPGRTLRAGLETLAHAFGDVLYVRVDAGHNNVPCPACGDCAVVRFVHDRWELLCCKVGDCPAKTSRPRVVDWRSKQGWCGFSIESLLALEAAELHLDGPWNPGGRVRRDELAARYETFTKERDHADAPAPQDR